MDINEQQSALDRLNEMMINVRNELIVQTANLYLFGRQVALTSVGMAALGVDELQTLMQAALERGEIAEEDAQKMIDDMRQQASDRAKEAERVRVDMTEKAAIALKENIAMITKYLGAQGNGK